MDFCLKNEFLLTYIQNKLKEMSNYRYRLFYFNHRYIYPSNNRRFSLKLSQAKWSRNVPYILLYNIVQDNEF